jgi:beta-amylase
VEQYRWAGYRELFEKIRSYNLKVQVVMSFHSCGGNVGDDVQIELPRFVDEVRGFSDQAHLECEW